MGGRKPEKIQVSIDAKKYVKGIIKNYSSLRETCCEYERTLATVLERTGINTEAFSAEAPPSETLLVEADRDMPFEDAAALEEYLFAKEKLYILERSMGRLPDLLREVAGKAFIEKTDRPLLARQLCISEATLYRYEAKALERLARDAETYIRWKVKKMYM